ncbi:hypothetical protein AB1Y20_009212 [Prymnesium parvum]|uniref:Uncharacterized protein n=1 Tax=Prymnesium parvum TaxID=97485 RepID=A0AB34K466_PRYPA
MADSTSALTDATRGIGVLASACRSTSPNDTWYVGCFASCRRARCHRCMCRACPVCTQRPPSDSPKVAPLAWERDVAWYRERIISDALRAPFRPATRTSSGRPAGCCPTAVALYKDRYHDFRCCTGRLNQLPPLRPRGGLGWPRVASLLANLSIYLVGDSLAEQHFLALACLAWATPGFAANLVAHSVPSSSNTRPAFERVARVVIEPIGTTILLTKTSRYNPSMALPSAPHVTDAIQTASFVVVGGWHHHIDRAPARLASLLDRISQMRTRRHAALVHLVAKQSPRAWSERTHALILL